jgi:hypothetical protein
MDLPLQEHFNRLHHGIGAGMFGFLSSLSRQQASLSLFSLISDDDSPALSIPGTH